MISSSHSQSKVNLLVQYRLRKENAFAAAKFIPGAKYYYFRGVLHNWPDHRAQEILRNVSLAMDDRSVILIDELVLPPSGVHEYVTGIDLMMMTGLASLERTKPQWQKMLDLVGLEIKEHRYYKPAGCEGVMVVGLKKAALKD